MHQLARLRLQVQSQQRLGVALADVEPPVLELDRDPVEVVHAAGLIRVGQLANLPVLVFHLEIHLAGLRVALERIDQRAERPGLLRQH